MADINAKAVVRPFSRFTERNLVFTSSIGGESQEFSNCIAVGASGLLITGASFSDSLDLVPGEETRFYKTTEESQYLDLFVVKLKSLDFNTIYWHTNKPVEVYPNPSSDKFYWSSSYRFTRASIRTLDGKVIKQVELHGNSEIDISELPVGFFTLHLCTSEGECYVKKVWHKY